MHRPPRIDVEFRTLLGRHTVLLFPGGMHSGSKLGFRFLHNKIGGLVRRWFGRCHCVRFDAVFPCVAVVVAIVTAGDAAVISDVAGLLTPEAERGSSGH